MAERFVTTSTQSWGSRLSQSLGGVVIGTLLFVVAFPLLWWNEGRAVRSHRSLTEGAGAVISVPAERVEDVHEGHLVHVIGRAVTGAQVADPTFGVTARALALSRRAETYQWVESVETTTRKKVGGGEETVRTYSYRKEWREQPVDSSQFADPEGHTNPGGTAIPSERWRASPVTVGAFTLPDDLVDRIDVREPLLVSEQTGEGSTSAPERGPRARPARRRPDGNSLPRRASHPVAAASAPGETPAAHALAADPRRRLVDGRVYIGADPGSPAIGDLRVSFFVVPETEVSIVAAQAGASFAPYRTQAEDTIEMLRPGVHTAAAMFAQAQRDSTVLAWVLRVVGLVLMTAGAFLVLRPLAVVADVVPLLGDLLRLGLGLVAISVSLPLTLGTIAVSWLFYRPVVGVGLLVSGLLAFGLTKLVAARRRTTAVAAAHPAAG